MKATIDQIKEAKQKAESEINAILVKFAKEYELTSLRVDVNITEFGDEGGIIAITAATKIEVKL